MGLLAPVSPPTANRTLMPRPSPPPSPPAYFWPLGQICLLARRGVAHLGGWVGGIHVHGWAKPKDPVRRGVYPRAWDGLIETCSVRTNQLQPVSPFAATLQLRAERRAFAAPVSCAPTTIPLHLHLADRFPVLVVVCVSQPPSPSCLPGGAERLRTASYNYNSLHEQSLTVQERDEAWRRDWNGGRH